MPDRIGQEFSNYRLVKLLGRGGSADVYLGENMRLCIQRAIKIFHTQLTGDDVEKFHTETDTIARLNHPHIMPVLDFGVDSGGNTPYLVMEYAPFGSLRTRHPKGSQVPLTTVIEYLREIVPALQYAHDQHILHGDIKPENILIGRQGELLLSNFGIVRLLQTSET